MRKRLSQVTENGKKTWRITGSANCKTCCACGGNAAKVLSGKDKKLKTKEAADNADGESPAC